MPGQVAELPHVYTATTSGSVAFSILNEVQNCLHDLGRACTSPVVVAPGITYTLQLPATGNATGYAGALEWSCPGQFPPSTEGSLTFQVQISP